MSFHTRIKNRRSALFQSQEAFAHELEATYGIKVSWQAIQQWETEGGTAPNRSRMPAVVAALKTTSEWLLYGTGVEDVADQVSNQYPVVSDPTPPTWINPEAYRLLELYFSLNERKRMDVLRFVEGLHPKGSTATASGKA